MIIALFIAVILLSIACIICGHLWLGQIEINRKANKWLRSLTDEMEEVKKKKV